MGAFALSLSAASSYYVSEHKGASTISVEFHTSNQAWKLIERDYTLRLSLVADEWASEHLKAWNAVFAEGRGRGNASYYGPALVEMEIADAEKRAEWSYRTCCEIWESQRRTKCRPFFRAIFDWCLQPMFSVSDGCFKHRLDLHAMRTRRQLAQGHSAILGHMKREMGKLRARWNTILEVATRDAENQERLKREREVELRRPTFVVAGSPPLSGGGDSIFTWRELEIRFRDLHSRTSERRVSANFIRTEWDSGSVTEEWILGGNAIWRAEFEAFASIAARKLGWAQNEGANDYWLDRVREWMQQARLDKDKSTAWLPTGTVVEAGLSGRTGGLYTERIAELSAMFCTKLIACGTPESAVSLPPELERVIGVSQAMPSALQPAAIDKRRASRGDKRLSKAEMARRRVIFGAIQANLKGKKYFSELDSKRLSMPPEWKERGCPYTYSEAYRIPYWRQRIQDQKANYQKKYDATPGSERESIIDGSAGTRRTRH